MTPPPGKGPLDSPGYQLWTRALAWTAAVADALRPLGLTHTQFFVLGGIRWLAKTTHHAPKVREVADFASLDRMTTSQVVRTLEGRGLVTREDDPDDSRAWRLGLTKPGEVAFQAALPLVKQIDATFFAPPSTDPRPRPRVTRR